MRVRNEKWITMTFDDSRPPIHARQIGKGRWTTAYHDGDAEGHGHGHVYLFVAVRPDGSTDYSKEAIAFISGGNQHIPAISKFDDLDGMAGEWFNIYRTEFYYPLTAKCGKAWQQFKRLATIAEEEQRKITLAIGQRDGLRFLSHEGHNCMDAVIERAKLEPEVITSELVEALESLQSAASDYGSTWWFEFAKRNCAVDAHGNLVLLDCIYDRQQVEREHAAAAKARRTA